MSRGGHGSGADDLGGLLARAVAQRGHVNVLAAGSLAAPLSTAGRRELHHDHHTNLVELKP